MRDIKKENRKRFRFFSFLISFLITIGLGSNVWADDSPMIMESEFGDEYTKSGTFIYHRIRIDDGIVVWDQNDDIFMREIESGIETQITDDVDVQRLPEIKDGVIVWTNETDRNFYKYEIATGTQTQLTGIVSRRANPIGFDGSRIVISGDCRSTPRTLRVYDVLDSSEEVIANGSVTRGSAFAISGNYITYFTPSVVPHSYVLYNMQDSSLFSLTRSAPGLRCLVSRDGTYTIDYPTSISGDKVVWMDWRDSGNPDGPYNIFMYDISTGEETQITDHSGDQRVPSISGDKIVWADARGGDYDIYMYDIETGIEIQITDEPGDQLNPSISGNDIVWHTDDEGTISNQMAQISYASEEESPSESVNENEGDDEDESDKKKKEAKDLFRKN